MSLQHWSSWWARVDYASRAAKNSLAGCFCPAGRKAPGRSCSHPPAYVSLTFAQKKTASVSLHQRFFHGRGWITQAAHLKRPRRGLFAAGTQSAGPQLFSSTRLCESDICAKENRQCISTPAVFSWARVDYASRAAKNSPLGCFCAVFGDSAAAVRIHPWICFEKFRTKEKLQCHYNTGVLGGRGWIRTTEAEKQQIYSLSPLATREHAHIQFFAVADCLYILPLGGVFVNCFLQLFQKRS